MLSDQEDAAVSAKVAAKAILLLTTVESMVGEMDSMEGNMNKRWNEDEINLPGVRVGPRVA